VKLRIFGGPILRAAQRMRDGRVVPIIEETFGGAPLSALSKYGGSSTRRAHALFQMTIYAARARHSANAAERLSL
jgi:hypothetical protein